MTLLYSYHTALFIEVNKEEDENIIVSTESYDQE